jgi:UDP-N-acetyl-D-glucosamine dehydrogenase
VTATVIALGKIGLPLAVQFARSGTDVIGTDISQPVVDLVNDGVPPFPGEAHLDEYLAEVVRDGKLTATTDTTEAVRVSDVVVIVVPLMVDDDGVPDFRAMDSATRDLAEGLHPGTLVSYETTLPVGSTRDRFAPMIEEICGLKAGIDYHLVHSPERVFTGRVFADLQQYPKLIGGVTEACAAHAVEFYESVLQFNERPDLDRANGVWDMGSVEAAELAKLAETTYRDVNIALANEFARFAEDQGIDIYQVIAASNSQPYSHIHLPGVAVGGHCIPVYPRFYLAGDPSAKIPAAAREVNLAVPGRVVAAVERELGTLDGKTVLIAGAAYRGKVKETAFSGVFSLVREVEARGGRAVVQDPMYTDEELVALSLAPVGNTEPDALIVQANHPEYHEWGADTFPTASIVYDGRNVLDLDRWKDRTVMVIGRSSTT